MDQYLIFGFGFILLFFLHKLNLTARSGENEEKIIYMISAEHWWVIYHSFRTFPFPFLAKTYFCSWKNMDLNMTLKNSWAKCMRYKCMLLVAMMLLKFVKFSGSAL